MKRWGQCGPSVARSRVSSSIRVACAPCVSSGSDINVARAVAMTSEVILSPIAQNYLGGLMPAALVSALRSGTPLLSVELRPPRAELDAAAGMDAWIDTYHAVRGLV